MPELVVAGLPDEPDVVLTRFLLVWGCLLLQDLAYAQVAEYLKPKDSLDYLTHQIHVLESDTKALQLLLGRRTQYLCMYVCIHYSVRMYVCMYSLFCTYVCMYVWGCEQLEVGSAGLNHWESLNHTRTLLSDRRARGKLQRDVSTSRVFISHKMFAVFSLTP